MKETEKSGRESADIQTAAVIASTAIAVGFVVYWTIQIQAVREMLQLAYG